MARRRTLIFSLIVIFVIIIGTPMEAQAIQYSQTEPPGDVPIDDIPTDEILFQVGERVSAGGLTYQDPPMMTEDGNTVYNAVPPAILLFDPDEYQPDFVYEQDPEIENAISGMSTPYAKFNISFKLDGQKSIFGHSCKSFPEEAKTAFIAAAAIWERRIKSSVPITIEACWTEGLAKETMGVSGGQPLHQNFINAPEANIFYQGSVANSIAGKDLAPDKSDMHIVYNATYNWYYGTDGKPPLLKKDLVTVAAHEIAHGLGFSGSARYEDGIGSYGFESNKRMAIYDTFMRNEGGKDLSTYTNPSKALGDLYTSGKLWWLGENAKAANGGRRVKMYAPSTWKSGSSFSHLDHATYKDTNNKLMVPYYTSAIHFPGPITMGILEDMGWDVSLANSVPSLVSPSGQIIDKTPTYKWTRIAGATNYNIELYKSGSLVWSKERKTGICGTDYCSITPILGIGLGNFQWRVRVKVADVWRDWSTNKSFSVIAPIPTPVSPSGEIADKTPTYKWTKIPTATKYQIEFVKGTDTVYNLTRYAGSCGTTHCTTTPARSLETGTYKWRVRAYANGLWRKWSYSKQFTLLTGFNSTFTYNAVGWENISGQWNLISGGFYGTPGVYAKFANTAHTGRYSTFTYTVRMRRYGEKYSANVVYVRGTPYPKDYMNRWYEMIKFEYTNNQNFSIWKSENGILSMVKGWTYYSGIKPFDWNTLKVVGNGSFFKFYINGNLVWQGFISGPTSGRVGVGMYKDLSAWTGLRIDYANLIMTAQTSENETPVEVGDTNTDWNDMTTGP